MVQIVVVDVPIPSRTQAPINAILTRRISSKSAINQNKTELASIKHRPRTIVCFRPSLLLIARMGKEASRPLTYEHRGAMGTNIRFNLEMVSMIYNGTNTLEENKRVKESSLRRQSILTCVTLRIILAHIQMKAHW